MPVEFNEVRYIKLGRGGCWNDIYVRTWEKSISVLVACLHELAISKDHEAIRRHTVRNGSKRHAAERRCWINNRLLLFGSGLLVDHLW